MTFPRLLTRVALPVPIAALLALPATASAVEVGVRIEPGFAVPLTAPQSQLFNPGGEVSLKAFLGLGRYFDVQAGATFLGLGAQTGTVPSTTGTAWADSLGFRLKRPHDADLVRGGFFAGSPWVDGDALHVRTGNLDRFGVTVGAGVSFPLGKMRHVWLGPFVRYMQIVETKHQGFDDRDGRFLFLGLNLELGTSPLPRPRERQLQAEPCPTCPPVSTKAAAPVENPDRDSDGVINAQDNCPDVNGPIENRGCPVYKKVTIKPDKLELNEQIFFAFDKADIEPQSFPLLDEVVQALKDNRGFRVEMEGHTDSTGSKEHNQTLSEQRAESVLAYLRAHGINPKRLSSKGFGEGNPSDTNTTAAGRENNRRVDFAVHFRIIDRSAQ
jgi:outer membrane protein OmpA-like peptidoglycan-associated protein